MRTARTNHTAPTKPASESGWRDIVVLIGGAAFSLAVAFGLYAQLGMPILQAGAAGLVLFVALAAIQVALRRSEDVATLRSRVAHLEQRLSAPGALEPDSSLSASQDFSAPQSASAAQGASAPQSASASVLREAATEPHQPPMQVPHAPADEPLESRPSIGMAAVPVRGARPRVVSGWSTPRETAAYPAAPDAREYAAPAPTKPSPGRNAPAVARAEGPPPLPPHANMFSEPAEDASHYQEHSFMAQPPAASHDRRRAEPETNAVNAMIGQIAGELGAFRPGEERADYAPPAPAVSAMEKVAAAPQSLTTRVLDAVEAGRVEIFLQPIVGLEDRKVVSYEAFPRLKDANGVLMLPSEYLAAARTQGVLAEIEKVATFRTINLLEKLEERQKLAPIFLNISRQTLVDAGFFREIGAVIKEYRQFASALVFEFTQREARAFNEDEFENLEALARMGFSFSVDEITDLEMDFVPLIERQFAFAKLRAVQLLEGLPSSGTVVPSGEIGPMFEEAGLQLMIEGIEDDGMLAHVETHGSKFGQGAVFAEPSPVKAEILSGQGAAA